MSLSCSKVIVPGSGHAFVRSVRARWRALTGGSALRDPKRRTLVACSGGADSAALVLALADRGIEVAHIVHDLRPQPDALADRDAVRDLCASIGVPFQEATVAVRERAGNAEANASRARYDALRELAMQRGIAFVATAHHAEDQLETVLLRLARGSGVRGLRGIAPSRQLGPVRVIRPMLDVSRDQCRELCAGCGFEWREDETNADISRARAAIRHTVLPALLAAEPRALVGASRTARQMRLAATAIDAEASRVVLSARCGGGRYTWDRASMCREQPVVIGAALRSAAGRMIGDRSADARTSDGVLGVVRAIRDESTTVRRFDWSGLCVTVDRWCVQIERNPL